MKSSGATPAQPDTKLIQTSSDANKPDPEAACVERKVTRPSTNGRLAEDSPAWIAFMLKGRISTQ
jgi:hypothetical protein